MRVNTFQKNGSLKTDLNEDFLDQLYELKLEWQKQQVRDTLKDYEDGLISCIADKIHELSLEVESLKKELNEKIVKLKEDWLKNPKMSWEMTYKVSELTLKSKLSKAMAALETFKNYNKRYNGKSKGIDIEAIKQIPIERFYEGPLKQSSNRLLGRCPFHSERTPSFFIYPTNSFCCFGCNKSGSVIDFYALKNKITISQSISELSKQI